VEASLTVFYSRQHDAIDYVRADPNQLWHAENLSGVAFTGVESSVNWQATSRQGFKFSETILAGAQSALHGLQSLYIFNYPVNNASAEWTGEVGGFVLRNNVEVVERYQQEAYPVWGASVARERGWIHPYLQMTNLSNTGYEEIEGVRIQGRSFAGGLELTLPGR
jgi:hypothetical protein